MDDGSIYDGSIYDGSIYDGSIYYDDTSLRTLLVPYYDIDHRRIDLNVGHLPSSRILHRCLQSHQDNPRICPRECSDLHPPRE